jgi:AcrR family transcriptional regulator
MPSTDLASPKPSLRERKKAQTRAAIQRHALRLFRQAGYHSTTMEQVAAAADVSPSTLYRYFPTKEDLVLADDYDPMLEAAYRAQPTGVPPLSAFRAAVRETIQSISPDELAEMKVRTQLTFEIPEVRARALEQYLQTSNLLTRLFAERADCDPDGLAVRVLAGTVIGALLAAQVKWLEDPAADLPAIIDEALALLIQGPAAVNLRSL